MYCTLAHSKEECLKWENKGEKGFIKQNLPFQFVHWVNQPRSAESLLCICSSTSPLSINIYNHNKIKQFSWPFPGNTYVLTSGKAKEHICQGEREQREVKTENMEIDGECFFFQDTNSYTGRCQKKFHKQNIVLWGGFSFCSDSFLQCREASL